MGHVALGAGTDASAALGSAPTLSATGGIAGGGQGFPQLSSVSPVTIPSSAVQVGEDLQKGSLQVSDSTLGIGANAGGTLPSGSGPVLHSAATSVGQATGTGDLGRPMTVPYRVSQDTLDLVSANPTFSASAGSLSAGGGSMSVTVPSESLIDGGFHVGTPLPGATISCALSSPQHC